MACLASPMVRCYQSINQHYARLASHLLCNSPILRQFHYSCYLQSTSQDIDPSEESSILSLSDSVPAQETENIKDYVILRQSTAVSSKMVKCGPDINRIVLLGTIDEIQINPRNTNPNNLFSYIRLRTWSPQGCFHINHVSVYDPLLVRQATQFRIGDRLHVRGFIIYLKPTLPKTSTLIWPLAYVVAKNLNHMGTSFITRSEDSFDIQH